MTGRRDVCSSHEPAKKISILYGDTIKEMIPSKLQFDHSRESSVISLINEKRRRKKKNKTRSVIAMSDLFVSQRHKKKKKRI